MQITKLLGYGFLGAIGIMMVTMVTMQVTDNKLILDSTVAAAGVLIFGYLGTKLKQKRSR